MISVAYAHGHIAAAQDLVTRINDVFLFPLIALLSAVAFIVFLYGAFEYVRNSASQEGRQTGQRHLLYGVIGLLVMFSAYTILQIAAGTFGVSVGDAVSGSNNAPFTSIRPQARPDDLNRAPETPGTVAPNTSSEPLSTAQLQQMVIDDYEQNTNIDEAFYMRDVRVLTTDIDGVDRMREINLAHYRGYISEATRDILLEAAEMPTQESANIDVQSGISNNNFGRNITFEESGFTGSGAFDAQQPSSETPFLGTPSERESDVVPGGLTNPNPNPDDTVVDTSSENPRYPVIGTRSNQTKEISCNNEMGCTGAIQSCTGADHNGVYSGVNGYNEEYGQYILCQP